ncbi:MAG: hypothetical protein IKD73_04205 [Selenomonadaceae bacterium]|nr:hypothetical protein [Selenomonadaceae bacterium]
MKKFIALVVVLCAVMISSPASATLIDDYFHATNNQILCMKPSDLSWYKPPSHYNSEYYEEARKREFYQLIFAVTLAIGIIAVFLRYQYNQNRQFRKENSFMGWFSNFASQKNLWAFVFCVVSLVMCIFYVPYNRVKSSNPEIIIETTHATIFEVPKNFNPRLTKIDYQAIAFREVLILLGCCAGYTVSTIINKKQ